ncbi:hypothetical protein LXL04_001505 [Taraxacum kok-saghyz]
MASHYSFYRLNQEKGCAKVEEATDVAPPLDFAAGVPHTVHFASGKLGQMAYRWLFTGHTVQSVNGEGFLLLPSMKLRVEVTLGTMGGATYRPVGAMATLIASPSSKVASSPPVNSHLMGVESQDFWPLYLLCSSSAPAWDIDRTWKHLREREQRCNTCRGLNVSETRAFRELNSGPLAPEARIIPLDQMPTSFKYEFAAITLSQNLFALMWDILTGTGFGSGVTGLRLLRLAFLIFVSRKAVGRDWIWKWCDGTQAPSSCILDIRVPKSEPKHLQSADHICKALQKKRWSKRLQSAAKRLLEDETEI